MKLNIPNALTLFRIFLIPVFVLVYYFPFPWGSILAASVFVLAGFTDWLDGYLARVLNQASAFGAFLDPVADKLMVAVALVLLVSDRNLHYIAVPAAVIIGREIAISALREWMADVGKKTSVSVSFLGKVKTAIQMLAIVLLLACNPLRAGILLFAGYVALYIAALLTLWSMIIYLRAAWVELVIKPKNLT
jgi:CDP-diacylglycerol---glycerol-3-phosphate 3-phosphatidyltransferase